MAISVSVSGQFMASGDQSGLIIVWDVLTSRKLFTKQYSEPIHCIDWSAGNILAFSHGDQVEIILWKFEKSIKSKGQ